MHTRYNYYFDSLPWGLSSFLRGLYLKPCSSYSLVEYWMLYRYTHIAMYKYNTHAVFNSYLLNYNSYTSENINETMHDDDS